MQNDVLSLEKSLEEVKGTLARIQSEELSKDSALEFISQVGRAYGQFTEVQKKEFASLFIEQIEIYQEEQENGDAIKSVTFRFPIGNGIRKLDFSSGNGQTTRTERRNCLSTLPKNIST